MRKDILENYWADYPFCSADIMQFVAGEKYVAIMLKNGQTGICATLGHAMDTEFTLQTLNIANNYYSRIVYQAWLNAKLNYQIPELPEGDIFEFIDFSKMQNIVMIGYFENLAEKIKSINHNINIFDFQKTFRARLPESKKKYALNYSDCVVVTATSITNKSFSEIIDNTPLTSKIFLLGPSSILDKKLFSIPRIHGIFGSRLTLYDSKPLEIILNNGGTRDFLPFMKKVALFRNN